jgi:membrane protein DedA with SNARE-associated domain
MESTIITIVGLALIENLILYYLGKILTRPEQLRHFLGLNNGTSTKEEYKKISSLLDDIGHLIMLSAILNFIITIINASNISG